MAVVSGKVIAKYQSFTYVLLKVKGFPQSKFSEICKFLVYYDSHMNVFQQTDKKNEHVCSLPRLF